VSAVRSTLAPGQIVKSPSAQGVEVAVEAGRVWITEESRLDDIWLAAGSRVKLDGEGLAILEAVGPARIRVD